VTGRVAITGAGAVTPPADGLLDRLPVSVRARAARAERITQLTLAAAGAALATAGLAATDGAPRPEVGVVLGTAFGCFLTNAAYQRRLAEGGPPAASPRLFAATVSNAAAGELGIAYRLGGPGITLSAGAASGLVALGHAIGLLRAGGASALVAGGVDAVGPALERWLAGGGLAPGRWPAEAAAMVVLETPAAAAARGAAALGDVVGFGAGFLPDPTVGTGLAGAIRAALADASVDPGTIALVVAAAPPALRAMEAQALAGALGGARPLTVTPKDALGETFGAAGPLGVLAALAEAPPGGIALVLDVCATGHVAAALVRRSPQP